MVCAGLWAALTDSGGPCARPAQRQARALGQEAALRWAGVLSGGKGPLLSGGSPSQGFLVPPTWRLSRGVDAGACSSPLGLRPQLAAPSPPPSSWPREVPLAALPPGSPAACRGRGSDMAPSLASFPPVPGGTAAVTGSDVKGAPLLPAHPVQECLRLRTGRGSDQPTLLAGEAGSQMAASWPRLLSPG